MPIFSNMIGLTFDTPIAFAFSPRFIRNKYLSFKVDKWAMTQARATGRMFDIVSDVVMF